MIDEPELVHALLDLATETTITFTRKQKELVGEPLDSAYHFHYRIPGGVRVVDDSAISLSPAMYEEFCRPYTERVFAAFGGGYMHYCGHQIASHPQRLPRAACEGLNWASTAPNRNPAYTLESVWRQGAEARLATLWVQDGLPPTRPAINTGLVYSCLRPELPWERAKDELQRVKGFWTN